MSKKMEQAMQLFEMIVGAVEKNAPHNEELTKMLQETRMFLKVIRKNSKIVEKWVKKEYPEWKTLTVYFRERSRSNEQDEQEDFVL